MIVLKSPQEIELMRESNRIVAEAHEEMRKYVEPGITTIELDRIACDYIKKRGGYPAFKGYRGFPANICISVNEEVVHGIPSLRKLVEGDIVSIDIGVLYNNYYGDAAATLPVGEVTPEAKRLLRVTEEALYCGIAQAKEGRRLSDISHAIQSYVESHGFSVVRDFVGHGIGREMHEEPQIPNFGEPGRGPRLKSGMTLAIEPMVNAGGYEVVTLADKWTVVTKDGSLSAHYEHTIFIADNGPEILTLL